VRGCKRSVARCARINPKEGAPLPYSPVREVNLHGEAMAAWRDGAQRHGEVRRKEKRPNARPRPLRLGRARVGVHICAREASLHESERERECADIGPGQRWHSDVQKNKEGSADGARALVKAVALARKASQPGSKAGITSGGAVQTTLSPSAQRPGHPQSAGEACSHLGGHGS
jgi:hypothetical protein